MKKYYDGQATNGGGGRIGNALFTIFPYKKGEQWMFDDEKRGILMEPFVAGADTLLEQLSGGRRGLTINFAASKFQGYTILLERMNGDENGTDYYCKELNHELWLCPALFNYITPAPNELYVQIKL